jgi:hypothetical protein
VTRNEDDRHVDPIAGDAFLQIETIETWKRNVKYEAARNKDSWAAEKFLLNLEQRGDRQTPRKSYKRSHFVGWKTRFR